MKLQQTKSNQVIRRGQLRREMEAANSVHGQQTAQTLGEYHMRYIEKRFRRIEWVLFPFRLWDLAWGTYRLLRRKWAMRKVARKAPAP